ncbi:MAG: Uma2 family endonuclease [Cyanobacteria bacterium P01_G01_bin.49]
MATSYLSPLPLVGEQRVIFYDLNWQAYQQILQALGGKRSAHLIYDRGTLEITRPLEEHEFYSELIGRFIYFLVSEMGGKIKTMGSTTLERKDLDRGAEPDKAYYIQSYDQVAGKRVDLQHDPPPDLVVEVDITNTDIDKLNLYANIGVPEFWRYNGEVWRIYQKSGDRYQEVNVSLTFPFIDKTRLSEFLIQAKEDEIMAEKNLRNWLKQNMNKESKD